MDHASGYIHVEHQVSLCASDTIAAKRRFERILYDRGVTVKSYRADNRIFNAEEFEDEIKKENQGITFSGVGRNIRMVLLNAQFVQSLSAPARV